MCSELSCPLCCLSNFPDIETFKLNLIKVNSKPIRCPLCDEILLGLDKLTIHLFGHSLPPNGSITEVSPQTLKPKKEQTLRMNQIKSVKLSSRAPEEKFRCEICGFVFVDEHLLSLHLNLVHNFTPNDDDDMENIDKGLEIKKFQCHLCSKHFKMKGALRIHIRVAHFRFQDQNKKHVNITDYLRQQTSIDQCTVKTETLSLKESYSHENIYQQLSLPIASSPASYFVPSPPNEDQKDSKKPSEKTAKVFQCEECKKTFTTKYFLKKHKRLHTGEMPYSCEKCGKHFFFQQSFHKHKLYCYTEYSCEKPYECTECGRSFKELQTLKNHERIHSGVKPFGCEICGKFFRQRVSFLVHSRIHNGNLPYKCSECGKGFRYKVSQRSHKCPGVLIKQPGELIQKLMQSSSNTPLPATIISTETSSVTNETFDATVGISIENQSPPELCLDDLLKDDGYNKNCVPADLNENTFNDLAFNNLAINSNYSHCNSNHFNMNFPSTLETINEDSIKELFGALR